MKKENKINVSDGLMSEKHLRENQSTILLMTVKNTENKNFKKYVNNVLGEVIVQIQKVYKTFYNLNISIVNVQLLEGHSDDILAVEFDTTILTDAHISMKMLGVDTVTPAMYYNYLCDRHMEVNND